MGFPQHRTWISQPPQVAGISALGLTPISVFSGAIKNKDLAGGVFTQASATSYGASNAGLCSLQTAANTGIYRAVTVPSVDTGYLVIWHGVLLGAPVGSTPKYAGIATSATSQSVDIVGLEVGTSGADYIALTFRAAANSSNRQFSVGMSAHYGKKLTIVGAYDLTAQEARLTICADGVIFKYSSAIASPTAPVMTGTEQFCVGPDVVEIPSRHTNTKVALGAVFYGLTNGKLEESIAVNPWSIFNPTPRLLIDAGSGVAGIHDAAVGLTAQSSTVTGTSTRSAAVVTHMSTGAIEAQDATIAGASLRTALVTTHAATGILSAQPAMLAGTASRAAASGSFATDILINNTGTPLASTAVSWSWLPLGRIGSLSAITPIDGTGTTNGSGVLTVSGLSAGAGIMLVADLNTGPTDDAVYYQAGTVA